MSGHLTQRGSISCYSKWIRAKAAIQSGVDLVLELPTSFACSSAERFALGGIGLLGSLGIVDCISFGSESGDISSLAECANKCLNINQSPEMQQLLKQGLSYPAARRRALREKGDLLLSLIHISLRMMVAPANAFSLNTASQATAKGILSTPTAVMEIQSHLLKGNLTRWKFQMIWTPLTKPSGTCLLYTSLPEKA